MTTTNRAVRKTRTERVADALVGYILEEGLREGDRLPATADLANRYGVSRTVVREAIAELAGRGIVRRGQGRETIVMSPGGDQMRGLLAFRMLSDGVTPEEALEADRAVELTSASLAAQRRQPEDLIALGRALDEMQNAPSHAARNEADQRFHEALVVASQNRLLALVFDGIYGLVRELHVRATAGRLIRGESLEAVIASHRAIYDAVARGDGDAAEAAMAHHLQEAADRLAVLRTES